MGSAGSSNAPSAAPSVVFPLPAASVSAFRSSFDSIGRSARDRRGAKQPMHVTQRLLSLSWS